MNFAPNDVNVRLLLYISVLCRYITKNVANEEQEISKTNKTNVLFKGCRFMLKNYLEVKY